MSGRPVFEMKIRVGWSLATYTVIFLPSSPNFLKYTSKGLFFYSFPSKLYVTSWIALTSVP